MREIAVENTAPPIGITEGRPAVLGSKHMVSSCHYLASLAGLRMFPRGGCAIDPGVAAGIAPNLLHRPLTGFGGGAPSLIPRPRAARAQPNARARHWPPAVQLHAQPAQDC